MFGDLAIMGLPFEMIAGFTAAQLIAVYGGLKRELKMQIRIHGGSIPGERQEQQSVDATAMLEAKVKKLKTATGKKSFDLWEII